MSQTTRRFPFGWVALVVVLLLAIVFLALRTLDLRGGNTDIQSAEVDLITVTTTVDASGQVEPRQWAVLYWKTTGEVAEINASVGDNVAAGDLLMSLDPSTTPPNIISAQAELIAAQEALNNLLNPSMMTVANAESAVAESYLALAQAEDNLQRLIDATTGVDATLDQAVTDARTTLIDTREGYPLANASLQAQMLYRAMRTTDRAEAVFQDLQDQYDEADTDEQPELLPALDAAEAAYEAAQALEDELAAAIDSDDVDLLDAQSQAQADYDAAVTDFIDAITGDQAQLKAVNLVTAQAQMTLAEAALFDALQRLNTLRSAPDPDELASAEARLRAAQATVDLAVLKAPFAGEVLGVYYALGDIVAQNQPAATLADLSELHVTVQVDETEVTQIESGDPATVTFSALPDLEMEGAVRAIAQTGQTVQGLVKYDVEVVLNPATEDIPLGITADVSIEVDVQTDVLAVPIDALQSDDQGEYVNVIAADGALRRVTVESGAIVGDSVAVEGNLEADDRVQVVLPDTGFDFGPRN